jgi:adhesin transport system outer membrane protein
MAKLKFCCLLLFSNLAVPFVISAQMQAISLQQVLSNMQTNYELLKSQGSLVQQKEAQKKSTAYNRLPHLNTLLQANIGSDNNQAGDYLSYGSIPSLESGERVQNNLSVISGDMALAGLNWEAVNFGRYQAQNAVAKSDLALQISTLAKTQYDLNSLTSAYYLELLRQFELQQVQQDNVNRLRDLKSTIDDLVNSGLRPSVDSSLATAEFAKSMIGLYEAQKNFTQTQVQLSVLSGIVLNQLNPDTNTGNKLIADGIAYILNSAIDTLHHPDINFYSSAYNLSRARLQLENKSYYPKIFLDMQGWERGSSLNNSDQYNGNLGAGLAPDRFNYFVGLTMTYDLFNIVRKRLNSPVARFGSESAYHELQNEKEHLKGDVQRASVEKDFQLNKLNQTTTELNSAALAYSQQLNLYNSGLSSIIELNEALDFYIRAQTSFIDARIGLMKSVLNYSLLTNSFNDLVQNLKL